MIKFFNNFTNVYENTNILSLNYILLNSTGELYKITDRQKNELLLYRHIKLYDNLDNNKNNIFVFNYDDNIVNDMLYLLNFDIISFDYNTTNKSFNIYENVNLKNKKLKELLIKIDTVWGDFDISHNFITKLSNFPKTVFGNFNISYNNISNLYGCPEYIENDFIMNDNFLTSYEGGPTKVGGTIICYNNAFKSLDTFGGHVKIKFLPNSSLSTIESDKYFINLYNNGTSLMEIKDSISQETYNKITKYEKYELEKRYRKI